MALPKQDDNTPWVVLNYYPNVSEAYIALGRLQADNIPAVLSNQTLAGVFALPSAKFSEVRLMVPKEFEQIARNSLNGV